MLDQIHRLLRNGESFAAIEKIEQTGTALEIAVRFHALTRDLYWKHRDLPALIVIGRAGILYCLSQSSICSESSETLRSTAKALAYDVGSFTWPGWEETGINPTSADLAFGMECARLNLRLAIELKKPGDRLSTAHWLLGAHALAASNPVLAQEQFQLAQGVLAAEQMPTIKIQPFNLGFLAIAQLAENANDQAAQSQFDQIVSQLKNQNDDDSRCYLAQLDSSRRLFIRKS